ncbi:type VII secretion protein EccB [Phytohabitans sp. ZYX-F-186]|uniref:Type VII secretion protein EccB n=1 Tax=Phytohabitans maris TaxID=3071409 RepID=A0ABU0ZQR5_9ACTN|nr:type VII secretion protein EccB [Phytohabitans sp. ZYX-F-186]MDQ7909376.1 type VII secretion protein EccB [Phytohabitans sp. ZYX-F-186]
MESRRDQVHAYFYLVGRLNSAVMQGRPDPYEPPNRRPLLGFVIGVLLAVVVAGGFGIYGIFRPGGDSSWRQPGVVILVKETGARYVLLEEQLRPVLNYASARLVLGSGGTARLVTVSRNSLRGVPVGAPIGIPDAPDTLPLAGKLETGAWTVCAQPPAPSGQPATTLLIGDGPALSTVAEGEGFLVATPDRQAQLVWQGRRYRLAPRAAVALGYAGVEPVPVTAAWLNPIPAGRDLAFPTVNGRGQAGPRVGDRTSVVGQVYEARDPARGTSDLYLARADGFVRLSRTTAALVLADPAVGAAYPGAPVAPVPIRPDELAAAPVTESTELVEGYPPEPPRTAGGPGTLPCVRYRPGGDTVAVTLARVPAAAAAKAVPVPRSAAAGGTADRILIPAGTGVLARNPYAPGGGLFLVTEYGVKYPLPDAGAQALGYSGTAPVEVPVELLDLLPTGAVLDPAAALASKTWGG